MPAILIADDEHHIRLLIEQTLEELVDEGVELYTASNGDEALEVLEHQRPELAFLDVQMPGRTGYEVCRAAKRDLGLSGTTVILLTAKGQADDRREGLEAGADDYLTKPFDPDDLLARAREVIGRHAGDGDAATTTA